MNNDYSKCRLKLLKTYYMNYDDIIKDDSGFIRPSYSSFILADKIMHKLCEFQDLLKNMSICANAEGGINFCMSLGDNRLSLDIDTEITYYKLKYIDGEMIQKSGHCSVDNINEFFQEISNNG